MRSILEKLKKLNGNHIKAIRRRGMDPQNYLLIRETYACLYLMDIRFNKVKIIYKFN